MLLLINYWANFGVNFHTPFAEVPYITQRTLITTNTFWRISTFSVLISQTPQPAPLSTYTSFSTEPKPPPPPTTLLTCTTSRTPVSRLAPNVLDPIERNHQNKQYRQYPQYDRALSVTPQRQAHDDRPKFTQ